jgi:hypothetical protein
VLYLVKIVLDSQLQERLFPIIRVVEQLLQEVSQIHKMEEMGLLCLFLFLDHLQIHLGIRPIQVRSATNRVFTEQGLSKPLLFLQVFLLCESFVGAQGGLVKMEETSKSQEVGLAQQRRILSPLVKSYML